MLFRLFSRQIKPDEVVVFYPTYASWEDPPAGWRVGFHASVHEPRLKGLRRAASLAIMRRALRISAEDAKTELFQQRAQLFLVDHERGKDLEIRCGELGIPLGRTAPNGHVSAAVLLTLEQLRESLPAGNWEGAHSRITWHSFHASLQSGDAREFHGCWQLIPARGLSVVSDIDDTIKISQVADRRRLLANTFLRPFEPVPGMAAFYGELARRETAFHYVSASPWQLYSPLEEFRVQFGFPRGSWHLRHFRLSDRSGWSFLRSPSKHKQELIHKIIKDFPERHFILIGDSSEQDPEIYGALARQFPQQVCKILIRESLAADHPKSAPRWLPLRYETAFAGLPSDRWQIFHQADELTPLLDAKFLERG